MQIETEIKDPKLAVDAIHAAGFKCRRRGKSIAILDGTEQAVLDVKSGILATAAGPSFSKRLDLLRQHYAEATYRAEASRHGIEVTSRTVNKRGDIVLMRRMK